MIEEKLVVGRFYWVIPSNDPDAEAWERERQPARFAGRRSDGTLLWNCLGVEGTSDWHMCWVGPEVVPSK